VALRPAGADRLVGVVQRPARGADLAQLGVILLFCLVVALYAVLCASFLAGSIGRPVASIARVIRDITERGDVTDVKRIPTFQRDEIGDLVDGANRMLDRLEEVGRASRAAEASLRLANEDLEERVAERTAELARSNEQLEASLAELRRTQGRLLQASRRGGMSDVASTVLHNVGNVLTSVNVSVEIVAELARAPHADKLVQLAGVLEANRDDLARFLGEAERGRLLPIYLATLAGKIGEEWSAVAREIARLRRNLEHIQTVIDGQQKLARGGVFAIEEVDPSSLVDEALDLVLLGRGGEVDLVRDLEPHPAVAIDRHLVLQILGNLLRNACEAVSGAPAARIAVRLRPLPPDRFAIEVTDSGSGIAPENLTRIFSQGFTTKRDGHGFGLHSSACSARNMGGTLTASSPGPGRGATFVLELPTRPPVIARAGPASAVGIA
jgi:signal transduction histidine kinase